MRPLILVTLCLITIFIIPSTFGDELVLKNGGRIKGVILKENAKEVVIKIGGGEMRIARKKIKEIIRDKKSDNKKLKEKQKESFQGGEKTPSKKKKFRSPKDLFEQMQAINSSPTSRLTHFAKFIVPSERKVYALNLMLNSYSLAGERGGQSQAALNKIAARFQLTDPAKKPKAPPIKNLEDAKRRADLLIGSNNYLGLIVALEGFFRAFNKDAYLAMKVVTEVAKFDVKEKKGVATLKNGQKVPITKLSDGWYLSMRNVP